MKIHKLRLDIEFCDAVLNGEKTFEIRLNDRGYQKGDHVIFEVVSEKPFDNCNQHPLNVKEYEITYVLNGWGLERGYVALAIKECKEQ